MESQLVLLAGRRDWSQETNGKSPSREMNHSASIWGRSVAAVGIDQGGRERVRAGGAQSMARMGA